MKNKKLILSIILFVIVSIILMFFSGFISNNNLNNDGLKNSIELKNEGNTNGKI